MEIFKEFCNKVVEFFSDPKCESCGETKEDLGCLVPSIGMEPIYCCVNKKCEKSYKKKKGE